MLQQKLVELALGMADSILAVVKGAPLGELDELTDSSLSQRAPLEGVASEALKAVDDVAATSRRLRASVPARLTRQKRAGKTAAPAVTKSSDAAAKKDPSRVALVLKHLHRAPKFVRADKLRPRTGLS